MLKTIHPVSVRTQEEKRSQLLEKYSSCINNISDACQRYIDKHISKQASLLLYIEIVIIIGVVIQGQGWITLGQCLNSSAVPQYQGPQADNANLRMNISPRNKTTWRFQLRQLRFVCIYNHQGPMMNWTPPKN